MAAVSRGPDEFRGGVYVSSAYDGYPVYGGGGGHGGVGGGFSESPLYNGVYGDFAAPENPGSGGGGGDNSSQALKGHGGGAVRIAATGTVTLGGGGNAGGGGGRIAVIYDKTAQQAAPLPTTVFTAAGGKGGNIDQNRDNLPDWEFLPYTDGDIGTLYFPDSQFLTRQTGPIAHAGQWMAPDFTVWSRDALTFNNAWLRFASGFRLDVTNALVVQGTDNRLHKLELPSGDVTCDGGVLVNKASLVLKADINNLAPMFERKPTEAIRKALEKSLARPKNLERLARKRLPLYVPLDIDLDVEVFEGAD